MKQCTKCKRWKDETEFSRQSGRKDGLRCWCKQCGCEYIHQYYRRNKEHVRKKRSYEESHRVVGGVRQKQCIKCRRWKPESEFQKLGRAKDGLQWECKKCATEYRRLCRKRRLPVRN